MLELSLFLAYITVAGTVEVGLAPSGGCGVNKTYTDCGTACPFTCENYKNPPQICTLQCIIGCVCKSGYVKNSSGQCVLPVDCPKASDQKCPPNEYYSTCANPCPRTCEDPDRAPCYGFVGCTISRCECIQGYIRRVEGGPCIKEIDCKGRLCKQNEVLDYCFNCEGTCSNPEPKCKETPGIWRKVCRCKVGFIRDKPSGTCIPLEQCPKPTAPPKVCGRNEEVSKCDVPCQPTCQEPNRPPCPTFWCGGPDCVCKQGFIRSNDGGPCIPRNSCRVPPPIDPCGLRPCVGRWCKNRCECRDGFFKNRQGVCIPWDAQLARE